MGYDNRSFFLVAGDDKAESVRVIHGARHVAKSRYRVVETNRRFREPLAQ